MPPTVHVPVMPVEALELLDVQPGQFIVDGTLGGGGHAGLIAQRVGPEGIVLGLDRDPLPIERASAILPMPPVRVLHASYHRLDRALEQEQLPPPDGMLLDLGLSSDQLEDSSRGFSFRVDGPLDLRFDIERGQSAADLLQQLSEQEIADVIYRYGEERFSRRIARRIVQLRQQREPVTTTAELARLVRSCVPRSKNHAIDPATRTFQALRIAVNEELTILEETLRHAVDWLRPGGRLVVISFHSLEDRLVKHAFRDGDCWDVITKRPLTAGPEEVATNPRSRSAKMRAAKVRPAFAMS